MKQFCVIGIGHHAREKIIPSLQKIKNVKIYSVTRSKKNNIHGVKNFLNINKLDENIFRNFLFIISTPPKFHLKYIKILIKKNAMIAVEKPAILNRYSFNYIKDYSNSFNNIFVETFYYKLSRIYHNFLKDFKKQKLKISKIKIFFLLPDFPKNTFRDNSNDWESIILDIGCYCIDLLISIGLNLSKPKINYYKNFINIYYFAEGINISLKIGIGKYTNKVVINTFENNESYTYEPFFYSRKGIRSKIINNNFKHDSKIIKINEDDLIKKFYSLDKNSFKKLTISSINNLNKSTQYFQILKKYVK